jgi:hypothetical protein
VALPKPDVAPVIKAHLPLMEFSMLNTLGAKVI